MKATIIFTAMLIWSLQAFAAGSGGVLFLSTKRMLERNDEWWAEHRKAEACEEARKRGEKTPTCDKAQK